MNTRLALSLLLPFLALIVQWLLWPWISPFVWFLFFPTVFFSARLGGFPGGLISTLISAAIVWFFFIPPQFSWTMANPNNAYSVIVFLIMGYLFSDTQERLRSAQQRAEAALQESRVANKKITALYEKTLELDELKSQFFSNVSHELRTPLTLIMSPLMQRLAKAGQTDEERQENEMMLRNAQLLYRHVSDLLDAAKLESGRMQVNYSARDIGELVRTIVAHFDSLAKEKEIDLQVETPQGLIAEIDVEKVQRILLNLLSNAFKFTPEKGRIAVRLHYRTNVVVIEVVDNGPGIPEDQRELVFERFRQIEGDMQRRHGGTGLGLAIIREFAQLHGGHAHVEDAPGGGACFLVELPVHAPDGSAIQKLHTQLDPVIDLQMVDELHDSSPARCYLPEAQENASLPRILVVEDNTDMRTFIINSLRSLYQVVCAVDGQDGLEQALHCVPDLIICDVMMPRMSGDQMVSALRQHPSLADIPIIMLTAKADDALRVSLLKMGVQDYLNKPFAVDELLARVEGLVSRRRQTQKQLYQSQQRFDDVVSVSADWVWEMDVDAHYTYASETIFELLGYRAEEVFGKSFFDLMPVEEAVRIRQILSPIIQHHAPFRDLESINLHKDGSLRYVLCTGVPIFDASGAYQGCRGLCRDITKQKLAEEQLLASEKRLQLALDATQDGLWDWDVPNDMAFLAPHYYEMCGYSAKEVTPNFAFFKTTVHPDDLPHILEIMGAHMQGKTLSSEFDYRLVCKNGEIKWVKGRGKVVARGADGEALRIIGTISDISVQKATEEMLRRRTEELSEQNAELMRFNQASVGRELDMIELKRQINTLSLQLGHVAPFPALPAGEGNASQFGIE